MRRTTILCALIATGCLQESQTEPEPELSESVSALMSCDACSAASSCSTRCTDSEGFSDYCVSYTCESADPCGDNAATSIEARRAELPAWSCATSTLYALTINGQSGYYRNCTQGRIVWSQNTCAQRMPTGAVYDRYFVSSGNVNTRTSVGFPTAAPVGTTQRFQAGYLATNANGFAAIVGGTAVPAVERAALIAKWEQPIAGKLPAHDTVWMPGVGAYFDTYPYLGYDKTFMVKAGASKAYAVVGEVQNKYVALGRWTSWLGWPTGDEKCLDVPCKYVYSNFEAGHIRWSAGPDRGLAAVPVAGAVPVAPRAIVHDPDLGKKTFTFTLSRSLKAAAGEPDSDQDGLNDDAEKQLAFLTAPRIFWDEGESASENEDPIGLRRLDMVQVRPRSGNVSTWQTSQGRKWVTIRFMMAYPMQTADRPYIDSAHIGDLEMFELRLFSAGGSFSEWRVGEFVFPPHGGKEGDYEYAQYYGDVGILATRAELLGTNHLWVATDEDSHGTWGGGEIDSSDCTGGGTNNAGHNCFTSTLQGSLADGDYWWFDPTRDIGEPEALRFDAWPLDTRGTADALVAPQIKREPNNPFAAYIENSTGQGIAREYVRYIDNATAPEIPTAKAFCGWRCPVRKPDGQCEGYPHNGFPALVTPEECDGGGSKFPTTNFTTDLYGSLYPVGGSFYRFGVNEDNPDYQAADFTYQLWGGPNILPLSSGNVASHWQYGATTHATSSAAATAQYSYPANAVNDGDRKGSGWSIGGGWSSSVAPTATAPQSLRVEFDRARVIKRVEVFTLQDNWPSPVEPTATTLAPSYGIRDYQVQYCPASLGACATYNDTGWVTLATVAGNDKAWRTHTFAPVTARSIRVRVTAAAGGNARITELEAWE